MKILILSDETWEWLVESLHPETLAKLLTADQAQMPDGPELHRLARARETPEIFDLKRKQLEGATDAQAGQREGMHTLIRHAHRQGIGVTALARWSGYDASRIYQILDPNPA